MEDFESQHIQALSAHVQGLEAALEALHGDESLGASLRRLARSLASAADRLGAGPIASHARAIQEADDADLEARTRELLEHVEALRSDTPTREVSILLVEDNRTVATAVKAYLKGEGRKVYHAGNAAKAEKILAEKPIDLVLLDLILPDRDGRDLLIQMRENQATASVPVIVLSAAEGAVAKAECLAVGAAEFLEKPVEPKALRAAVARHARPRVAAVEPPSGATPSVATRADLVERFEGLRPAIESGSSVTTALVRIDDMARIEEEMGAEAGERLLDAVAQQILVLLDASDTVGRWERSDLVALFPDSTSTHTKQKVKDGLKGLAGSTHLEELERGGLLLTFSTGVSVAEPGQDLRDVVSAAEHSLLKARRSGQATPLAEGQPARTGPPRLLLVEDDKVTATLIHHRLVREGFEVMDFLNGEDAFTWASESSFDLAILDVKVPGMDGFELLERLRAMPRLDDVPIVMLTGLRSETDVIRGLELGANDYMLKPFSPTELIARVRRLLYATADAP